MTLFFFLHGLTTKSADEIFSNVYISFHQIVSVILFDVHNKLAELSSSISFWSVGGGLELLGDPRRTWEASRTGDPGSVMARRVPSNPGADSHSHRPAVRTQTFGAWCTSKLRICWLFKEK